MDRVKSGEGWPFTPLGSARQRLVGVDRERVVGNDDVVAATDERVGAIVERAIGDRAIGDREEGGQSHHAAYLSWEIAGWATELPALGRARLSAIVLRLLNEIGAGNTRLAVDAEEAALLASVPTVCGSPDDGRPLVLVAGYLSTQRLHAAEARLATALSTRRAQPTAFSPADVASAIDAVVAQSSPAPTAEQRAASEQVLQRRLGVVTGGPGTGKTTIVFALVRALERLGVPAARIALAAPTGKAANRLGEALRLGLERLGPAGETLAASLPTPETLHRLLRHSPETRSFAHREGVPLPFDVVIVDESSMIDLPLMDRLLAALAPDAQLVLLGDADQLPSVEAGAVFRDLAPMGVRLTRSHRMDPSRPEGRRILTFAHAVRDGAALGDLLDRREDSATLVWDGVELCPGSDLPAFLAAWFDRRVAISTSIRTLTTTSFSLAAHGGFAPAATSLFDQALEDHQRARLLAVTRGRPTGADALNAALSHRFGARGPGLVAGEPVMMLRNDYDRGLYNGDQGIVIELDESTPGHARRRPRACAIFPVEGRWTPFPVDGLKDALGRAFALTVHKAQGSEYDEIALVLPDTPHPLLTRDLVYTALTRCRRAAVICGDESVLQSGLANARPRSSGLAARLAGS